MIAQLVASLIRRAPWLGALALVWTLIAALFASNLRLDGDLSRLLPSDSPTVRGLSRLERDYGAQVGRVAVIVTAQDPQAARDAAEPLAKALATLPGVARVEWRDPLSELRASRLLYMALEDVTELSDRLQRRIRWERQRANPLFAGLGGEAPEVDLSDIEARYEGELPERTFYQSEQGKLVVFAHPDFPASDLDLTKTLIANIDKAAADALRPLPGSPKHDLTGRYVKRVEQQDIMQADMGRASLIALGLLALFLLVYLRSVRRALLTLTPLVVGTLTALAIAQRIFGDLNILTGFLGAILLGLGVDYGIHLITRHDELRSRGLSLQDALTRTLQTSGKANLYAGMTTMIALGSLVVSEFRAFYEFGIIALLGMGAILAAYTLLLPILITLTERVSGRQSRTTLAAAITANATRPPSRPFIIGAALIIAAAAILAPLAKNSRMDESFDSLIITNTAAYDLDLETNAILGRSQTPAVVLAAHEDHAQRVAEVLRDRKLNSPDGAALDRAIVLSELIPQDQDAKRDILTALRAQIDKIPRKAQSQTLQDLAAELAAVLDAPPISRQTLPVNLTAPLSQRDPNAAVVLVLNSGDLNKAEDFQSFARLLRGLPGPSPEAPPQDAISDVLLLIDILDYLRQDIPQMLVITGLGLLIVALVAFGPRREAVILAATITLAILATLGVIAVMGQPFNFINALIFPIWLGLGVDASFHMLAHLRESPDDLRGLYTTSLSVGAAFSTSMIGFGALTLSHHTGLRSLGVVALVGLSVILLVELSVIVLLTARKHRTRRA